MSTERAFVLSGGGIKGAFQAGAIAEILSQTQGFEPSILVGTSIGALNAAFLADRAGRSYGASRPVNWAELGASLEDFWRQKITRPSCIIEPKCKFKLYWSILRKNFNGFVGIDSGVQLVNQEILLPNLRQSAKRGLKLQVATVDVVDGRLTTADPTALDFMKYLIASSAMPVIMPLIKIGETLYTDGGIRHVAPVRAAIALGADDIVCVVCQAAELRSAIFDARDLLQLGERLMDIVTNQIVTNDLECLKERSDALNLVRPLGTRHVTVRIIRPSHPLTADMRTFTTKEIGDMIDAGHAAVGTFATRAVDYTLTVL